MVSGDEHLLAAGDVEFDEEARGEGERLDARVGHLLHTGGEYVSARSCAGAVQVVVPCRARCRATRSACTAARTSARPRR